MERLWIGPKDAKIEHLDEGGQHEFRRYLRDHGLDLLALENLCQGVFPSRNFIPLPGQVFKGRVKKLISSNVANGAANTLTIEADIGQLLLIEASRENVYVHGHWMGKADLRYVFENGEYTMTS